MDTASPVFHALMRRRNELAGEVKHFQDMAEAKRRDLDHINQTLVIMGYPVPGTKPKAVRTSGLFFKGELPRMILEQLRTAPEGITARQIAVQITEAKLWEPEPNFMSALTAKVGRQLDKMRKRYRLVMEGSGRDCVWRL